MFTFHDTRYVDGICGTYYIHSDQLTFSIAKIGQTNHFGLLLPPIVCQNGSVEPTWTKTLVYHYTCIASVLKKIYIVSTQLLLWCRL